MIKTIEKIPRILDKSNIDNVISDYLSLINEIPLIIQSKDILGFLDEIKRKPLNIGPYPKVTLFEASNRIMTDLTILLGVKELLNGRIKEIQFEKYTVDFGNENVNSNDIIASDNENKLIGEVFNVSKSFFQTKKINSLKKLRKQKEKNEIILLIYNSDAVKETYNPKPMENEFHLPIKIKLTNKEKTCAIKK